MELSLEKINSIDFSDLSKLIIEDQFKGYFISNAGQEHYKLLAHFSTLINNQIILDIGTYKGCSSLALSYNVENKVKSFDIGNFRKITGNPDNVEFIIADFTDNEYKQLVLDSSLILLDTDHTGPYEHKVYKYLKEINWVGYLLLDDINLNKEMKEFWNSIELEKYDITPYGHWSGTGLVIFK